MNQIDSTTLFFAAIFTNNILFDELSGTLSFSFNLKADKTRLWTWCAVAFVMASTAALNNLVYYHLLLPFHMEHFRYIVFIIIIAGFVQLVEIRSKGFFRRSITCFGIFLPLI